MTHRRLVDFSAGLIFGLRGSIDRVTNKVFLLSPANVEVTAEDKARIAERGFLQPELASINRRADELRAPRPDGLPATAVRTGQGCEHLPDCATYILWLYLLLLIGRLIIGWIQAFARYWSPSGLVLVVAEACLHRNGSATEIAKALHSAVRIGSVALDLSFMLLFLVIIVLLLGRSSF